LAYREFGQDLRGLASRKPGSLRDGPRRFNEFHRSRGPHCARSGSR